MTTKDEGQPGAVVPFRMIAQRIGLKLRDVYGSPEVDGLPADQVELLLRLRHKERERVRRSA